MWAYTVGFTVLPHVGGFLGWFINRKEIPVWYEKLKKPSWCPPRKIFPVAWTVLYTGMGYASYLIWNDLGGCSSKALVPLGLYGAQLALNWAWPPLFFGARNLRRQGLEATEVQGGTTVSIGILSLCGQKVYVIAAISTNISVFLSCAQALSAAGDADHKERINLGWLAMATCLTIRIWKDNPEQKPGKSE